MMKARTPLGKQIVKNILLYGREQGDLGLPDGNLTRTTKLIGGLPKAARKDVLAKPWMVHDLVDERDYNWNDKAVMKWLCEYKRADRLDILRADAAIEGLIIEGEDAIAINRPQVKKWFDKESDAGKAKMLEGCRAGQAFITAFGAEGLELVKRYVPVEKRGGVIVDRSTILFTIEEAVFVDYVRSLPLSQRADYTKPDARYYTPNKDPKIPPSTLTGPALQARL
jgi:hypothetical protein